MSRSTLWTTAALCALLFSGLARAQQAPQLDIQHFQPHADRTGWYVTHSARTLGLGQPAFGMWLSYARNPLVYYVEDTAENRVVESLLTMDLQAAIGFGVADLAVDMPIHLLVAGDGMNQWGGSISGTAAGDLRVIPKVRFLDPEKRGFGLGLVLPLTFPTANRDHFVGARTVTFAPMLALTGHFGFFRLGGNLGYRIAGREDIDDLVAGGAFLFRVAASVHPHEVVDIAAEFYGDVHSQARNNPVEWLVGATVHPVPPLGITIAGGSAVGPGIGAPEGRIVFAVGITPPVGQKDTDGDGIVDRKDGCPEQPEDFDQFEDEDGCPDPDNDQDGIPDTSDQCPDEPETGNGWQDEDGCPDEIPDTDGDGYLDNADGCPDDPEDFDKFEDEDGCPDPDNDQDQILDVDDACPNQPEVYNNVEDEDGCPDEGRVRVDKKEIVILDKVLFDTNKAVIKSKSMPLLDDVAAILERFPRLEKIEIQGHTDSRGSDSLNQRLSQQRADAVKAYLVKAGVAQGRLVSKGYGENQPIDPAKNKVAYEKNRRVQFMILEQD